MKVKALIKTVCALAYKHRATIETVVGMGLVVGGTAVIISKAKAAAEVTYDIQDMTDEIHEMDKDEAWVDKKQRNSAVRSAVWHGVKGYTKCYALGIGMEVGGLFLIGRSHYTMSKELSAAWGLVSSYAATISNMKERVIADQGEDKWNEYYYGPQTTKVEVKEDGTVVQTTSPLPNPNVRANLPPHCFIFDESNPNWEKDPVANLNFVENQLRWLRRQLYYDGFLFENDIRKAFGEPLVKCGYTSGIICDDSVGGNNLSFGFEHPDEATQRFLDGVETNVLIKLNAEDNIIDKLNWRLI